MKLYDLTEQEQIHLICEIETLRKENESLKRENEMLEFIKIKLLEKIEEIEHPKTFTSTTLIFNTED